MAEIGKHRLKIATREVEVDGSLAADTGWHDLAVRWLISDESVGSRSTVVGLSVFPPGAKHDLHRHPNAEEWEFVLRGTGIKRVEGEDVAIGPGDIVFTPRDSYHGVANTSGDVLETLWGYTGGASLEEAGYVQADEDPDPDAPSGAWPAGEASE
jgi:quercetin dioxygenase-like cupin family protein